MTIHAVNPHRESQPPSQEHRSVLNIFLSYAHEDQDIMRAVAEAFDTLNTKCGNVRTIYDTRSLEVGSAKPLADDIEEKLLQTDYFVIIYTGLFKRSHSYTGEELGFFRGLIRSDMEAHRRSSRRLVPIHFGEAPPVDTGELTINLAIAPSQLRMARDDFIKAVRANVAKSGIRALVGVLSGIASDADDRLPKDGGRDSFSPTEWTDRIVSRDSLIKTAIIPDLMGKFYDCFSGRVRRKSVEQRLIEFNITKQHAGKVFFDEIPDDTMLTEHGHTFALFGIGQSDDEQMSWGQFKAAVQAVVGSEPSPILSAIERSATSAISSNLPRDDEQIVRAVENLGIFRLIITKQFEYFDGSKLVHMYLVPILPAAFFGGSNALVTLGFINIAARYREMFIEPTSDICLQEFYRIDEFPVLVDKVRQVIRKLILIENEAYILKLGERRTISIYYGSSDSEAIKVAELTQKWREVRKDIAAAAAVVIAGPTPKRTEQQLRARWMESLQNFVEVSKEINASLLKRSIELLGSYLVEDAGDGNAAAATPPVFVGKRAPKKPREEYATEKRG